MKNSNGNIVKNQFIAKDYENDIEYFQSYQSAIVKRDNKNNIVTLDRDTWDYSQTTGKYRNLFLGESKAETEKKIKSGEYKLAQLN
jgi:hypothetical protein